MGETNHVRPPALATAGGARARLVRQLLGAMDQRWKERAACRGVDNPELFFPPPARADADIKRSMSERRRRIIIANAKTVCRRCPVTAECLAYADEIGDYNGVWGGLTPRERGRKRDER